MDESTAGGKNGCSRPPCSDPPPPSTLSLQSGCYLSIFTLLPSTDRPRPTYVHSPNDTWTQTHTKKYTITGVDNDCGAAKPLWVIRRVWVYFYVGCMCLYVHCVTFYSPRESPAALLFDQRFDQEWFSSSLGWFRNVPLKCASLCFIFKGDFKFDLSVSEFLGKQIYQGCFVQVIFK